MSDTTSNVVPFRKQAFTGKRRQVERCCTARTLGWPTTPKERFDLFDTWHCVAMQYARLNRVGLHFLAVAKIVMLWKRGTIAVSDKHLAQIAGGCSDKTIEREIGMLAKLGLITRKGGACRHSDGIRTIRTRSIRLAFPAEIDPRVTLPDVEFDPQT